MDASIWCVQVCGILYRPYDDGCNKSTHVMVRHVGGVWHVLVRTEPSTPVRFLQGECLCRLQTGRLLTSMLCLGGKAGMPVQGWGGALIGWSGKLMTC